MKLTNPTMALVKVFLTFRNKWILLLYFLGLSFFLTAFVVLRSTPNTVSVHYRAPMAMKPIMKSQLFYDLEPILKPDCTLKKNNT